MKYLIVAFVLTVSLISCGPKVIYDHKENVISPWDYDKPITFDYRIEDTIMAYDLQLVVYHSSDFTFENLYINATTIFPDGKKTTYPVSLQLAHPNGEWIGDCSGDKCKIKIEISSGAYYKLAGNYKLVIDQYARKKELNGIYAFEMKIIEHKNAD